MGKELTLRTTMNKVRESMEQSLVEVFGCVSLDDNETVKRGVGKDRMRINHCFYLDRSSMEETLVEVFGCIELDHKVIKLDVTRNMKKIEKELQILVAIEDSSIGHPKRVHDRLS